MLMLGDAMSIFARSTCAPSGNSPARIRRNRSRLSSTGRSRCGLFRPGDVSDPAILPDLVGRKAVDIRFALADQMLGILIHLLEVVGGVEQAVGPVEPEPADVLLDGVDVLDIFLRRVGVVEAEVAQAAELLGDAEVQADGLRMADVQISIRLRRKTGVDATAVPALFQIFATISRMKSCGRVGSTVEGGSGIQGKDDFNLAGRSKRRRSPGRGGGGGPPPPAPLAIGEVVVCGGARGGLAR